MLPNLQYRDAHSINIQVNLIGSKVHQPMVHVCETCNLPIKSYGRLIPCKHVFCHSCAKKIGKNCPRCNDEVKRLEQCQLGGIWMCSLNSACKRTYLSKRDLLAHINHRHSKQEMATQPPMVLPLPNPMGPPPRVVMPSSNVVGLQGPLVATSPNVIGPQNVVHPPMNVRPPPTTFLIPNGPNQSISSPITMLATSNNMDQLTALHPGSSNLITIPIQGDCSMPPHPVVSPNQQFSIGNHPVMPQQQPSMRF